MHTFELWAPSDAIGRVEVVIGNQALAMERAEYGWWRRSVDDAGFGTHYMFRLDGDPAQTFPDPRSHWQGQGPHGPSMVWDHAFSWTDQAWQAPPLSEAVLYEVHIGTFTTEGTYQAAIEKLSYLKELGITHIELMPVHQATGTRNWGYDGVYLYAPYNAYGTPNDLKTFVDQCHAHGLAILLDVVYNHFGPEGNHTGKFGPYTKDEHTPWGQAVNFDGPGSDAVREFVIDNALMWLEQYHFDGLRIDAMDELRDRSALPIMEEMTERAAALSARLGRPLVLTAEFDQNDPRVVTGRERGGLGLDAQWCDNFHHALLTVLTGDRRSYYHDFGAIELLAKALRQAIVFDGQFSAFRNKRLGRSYGDREPYRFIVFSANHDQVGNRPLGDRPAHRIGNELMKLGAALTLLSRFIPMVFQGEEWAASAPFQFFTDHGDPAVAEGTVKGRGTSFGDYGLTPDQIPNPQSPETFARSRIDWAERTEGAHAEMLDWYRRLIRLRHSIAGFGTSERADVAFDEAARWITMSHGGLTVACNLADRSQTVPLPVADLATILASPPEVRPQADGIVLPPAGVAVLARPEMNIAV